MFKFADPETIIQLTPQWKGERFPDGRPKVPDHILEALRKMTLEEIWKPIFLKGYESQFEGALHKLHSEIKLVGRAVTCEFAPARPDLHETMRKIGVEIEGRKGNYNQWVIDSLIENDVVVADMYDKIYKGTFLGGNLTTAIKNRTKRGGAVIWGGVRDIEQMEKIEGVQVYYRGIDPTPIRDYLMTRLNGPTKIGKAICMPGDIVFGAGGGVLFVPSHLAEEVVDGAAKAHVRDIYGFEMISKNIVSTADIDRPWTPEMLAGLISWIQKDNRGESYRYLDWAKELEESEKTYSSNTKEQESNA
jgi:regulator of RNase E activity RraA